MEKTLVLSSDGNYFDYTRYALSSFLEHNSGWNVLCLDVGMTEPQRHVLACTARLITSCCDTNRVINYFPAGRQKLISIQNLCAKKGIFLFLDSDTLTLGSVEGMTDRFIESEAPFGMLREIGSPMKWGWPDGIPDDFVNQNEWKEKKTWNCGVMFARGQGAIDLAEKGLVLYEKYRPRIAWGDQSIISPLIHELKLACCPLTLNEHFYHWSLPLKFSNGKKYVESIPTYNGHNVIIRHFCAQAKHELQEIKPLLEMKWPLKQ